MSELVATRIHQHAERLHLANLTSNLDALVARAEQATMGYLDFLDLLLEEEVGVREGRRFHNALKLSGLPHHKSLDGFDFAFQPDLDARKVHDLAASASPRPRRMSASSAHPGSARPCSRSAWPSLPARPATRSTSPPWTT
jgi:DNA replication protein DnaC